MTLCQQTTGGLSPDGSEPLLKWPGGKREILKHILKHIPCNYRRYYEPFVGGGALFFRLAPERAMLGDKNRDLVNCYKVVRDQPKKLVETLRQMRNTEHDYYNIRSTEPTCPIERAARIVYLTTLSFNGIYRENSRGKFNVPYGHKLHLAPYDVDRIMMSSKVLSRAELSCDDFEVTLASVRQGDVVYLDPPYTVAHSHNGFIKYNASLFSWDDQVRLAHVASELVQRGCYVVVSNADHESIHALYKGFECEYIERVSRISASRLHRRSVTECLYFNTP